jgi:hypothetical protein
MSAPVRLGLIQISGQDWALMDAYVRDIVDRVDEPTRLYLWGYAAASEWLAGTTTHLPMRAASRGPTLDVVEDERHLAVDTAHGGRDALPGVNRNYANGVWRMLAWATGIIARPPLDLPA